MLTSRKAADLDPDNAYAHNNLGVALESTGKFQEAKAAYSHALELDPGNGRIRENLDRLEAYLAGRLFRPPPPGTENPTTDSGESSADPPPSQNGGEGGS